MTDLFADVNGIKICYEIIGNEEAYPIIMVHGYGSKKTEWIAQVDALSEKYKLIIFDNRGAGKSDRPNTPYTMELYAEDIKGLMEFLKIQEAHILGASMGGMMVQHFVLTFPEMVDKVILINTFPGFPNEQGIELLKKGYIETYHKRLEDPTKAFFDGANSFYTLKFRKMMKEDPKRKFHGIFSAEDLIQRDVEDAATPQDILNGANAIAKHNTIDRLHEIQNKTLVLCAQKDRLSPVLVNEKLHELIPNSVLKIINGVGHGSPLEKAPEVNQALLEFLET
jgi:pimeloyl-ACP methyl ester carboxylesterase